MKFILSLKILPKVFRQNFARKVNWQVGCISEDETALKKSSKSKAKKKLSNRYLIMASYLCM